MVNGGKGGQMAKMGNFGRTNTKNALVNVLPNGRTKCQKEGRPPKGRTCGSSDASIDFFFIFLCYYKEVHHFLWPGGYLHCFKMAKRGGSSEIHCGNGRHLLEPDLQIELNPLAIFQYHNVPETYLKLRSPGCQDEEGRQAPQKQPEITSL